MTTHTKTPEIVTSYLEAQSKPHTFNARYFSTLGGADALELARMLDEIQQNNQRMTSLFNVLTKGTRRVIANSVTFDKASQYHNCIVKLAGMEVGA